jgi:hypothetical protein
MALTCYVEDSGRYREEAADRITKVRIWKAAAWARHEKCKQDLETRPSSSTQVLLSRAIRSAPIISHMSQNRPLDPLGFHTFSRFAVEWHFVPLPIIFYDSDARDPGVSTSSSRCRFSCFS